MSGSTGAALGDDGDEPSPGGLFMLCRAQEERISQLEDLNARKEQQLLKLHSRLEEALSVLQVGQRMYGEHQQMIELGQANLTQLCEAITIKGAGRGQASARASPSGGRVASAPVVADADTSATATPSSRGSAPLRGAVAAPGRDGAPTPAEDASASGSGTGDDSNAGGDLAEVDLQEMLDLMQRADELQQQLTALKAGGAASAAQVGLGGPASPARPGASPLASGPAHGPAAQGNVSSTATALSQALTSQAAEPLKEALSELLAEKDRLAEQLAEEQSQLESQLGSLFAEMREMEKREAAAQAPSS